MDKMDKLVRDQDRDGKCLTQEEKIARREKQLFLSGLQKFDFSALLITLKPQTVIFNVIRSEPTSLHTQNVIPVFHSEGVIGRKMDIGVQDRDH